MASSDLQRLFALLPTTDHAHAVPLFDKVVRDLDAVGPILNELVFVASNHDDPQLHTPHGLLTLVAGRDLLRLTRPPGGMGLLRFLFLYTFTLIKRPFTEAQAQASAQAVPPTPLAEGSMAYLRAVYGGLGEQAGALLSRIALDHGLEAGARLALRASLADIGRLGHNFVTAVAYVQTAKIFEGARRLVPLANLGRLQAFHLSGASEPEIPEADAAPGPADVAELARLVEDGEFDRVEAALRALIQEGRAEDAYRPLLVATSAEPGFLGHSLGLAHAARLATRYLVPTENLWLSWKLYRTLTTRFGYPEFLRLGEGEALDRESVLAALDASLQYKSPPAERTVRQALEAHVPLEDVLARIVDSYGKWTVGEKEHTISYLSAALHTSLFLGRGEALLPLTFALSKLPF